LRISVVIPARNEEAWLSGCLDTLAQQTRAHDEIIVVDDGSVDGTIAVAQRFGVRVVSQPASGVGRARRTGCEAATSEIIAMTDADTRVPPWWVARILQEFDQSPLSVGVTGPWELYDGRPWQSRCLAVHNRVWQGLLAAVAPPLVNLTGCNCAFRREAYQQVGGFDPRLTIGEDLDLSLKLRSVGRVRFRPGLVVHTSGRRLNSLGGLATANYFSNTVGQLSGYLLGRRVIPHPEVTETTTVEPQENPGPAA
jgi:glycosyltransferase involved in cell wall biosynthesis